MKSFKFVGGLVLAGMVSFAAAGASAQTPEELSCNFVSAMQKSVADGIEASREILKHFPSEQFSAISGPMQALPDSFRAGGVVEVARMGDFFIEHLVVVNSDSIGNVYFRVAYERYQGGLTGIQFNFNSDIEAGLGGWHLLQQPIEIDCANLPG